MSDQRRLTDADVNRIANAVAARLSDGESDSPTQSGSERTAEMRHGHNRRPSPSQRRGASARRDSSRSEQAEPTGGRVRDDVAARVDEKRGIERLDEPRAAGDTDRERPGAPSTERIDAGVTFESTLDEDGRVTIPTEIVTELDVEPGGSVRLTVHRTE